MRKKEKKMHEGTMAVIKDSRADKLDSHSLVMWPWANALTSVYFNFILCRL